MRRLIELKPELLASAVHSDHLFVLEATLKSPWRHPFKDDRVISAMNLGDETLLSYGSGQLATAFDFHTIERVKLTQRNVSRSVIGQPSGACLLRRTPAEAK